jgi:hypothetical protein
LIRQVGEVGIFAEVEPNQKAAFYKNEGRRGTKRPKVKVARPFIAIR